MRRRLFAQLLPKLLPQLFLGLSLVVLVWSAATRVGLDPVFQLGVALSLELTFGLVWLCGVRYPDVGWMVVIASLLSLDTFSRPGHAWTPWHLVVAGTIQLALVLAFGAFLLSFFRARVKPAALELGFLGLVTLFLLVGLVLPPATFQALRLSGTAQSWLAAGLLATGAALGWLALKPLPPKRQRYVALVVVASIAAAGAYLVQARLGTADAPNLTPVLDYAYATALGLFLLADLVIFHRNYVKDKAAREASRVDELQREARAELGRAIRETLLRPAAAGHLGEFHYEVLAEPAADDAADWHWTWHARGETRLLVGEVQARGALAPLGVAAIAAFLREAERRELPLAEAARLLNFRLLDLFDRQVTATLAAVSLAEDGTVELWSCGGAGFLAVSRDGGRHHPLNSTPLGVGPDLEIGHAAVPLDDGDVLVTATAGWVDPQGGMAKLVDVFDEEIDLVPSAASVRAQVEKLAPAAGAGDRTLVVIERRHAAMGTGSAAG